MANRLRKKRSNNFTKIANSMLNDKKLSWTARGLLSYMLSKPDDRSFNNTDLENRSEKDGRTVVENAKKELKKLQYLVIEKTRDKKGKWGYDRHISDEPLTGFPHTDKPSTDLPGTAEPVAENTPHSKIGDSKTEIISSKEDIEQSSNDKETATENMIEEETKEYGNAQVNELIKALMEKAKELGIAYDKTDDRNFAKHILTAKDFDQITELTGKTRIESAVFIMELSLKYGGDYPAGGPKKIYQRRATILNAYKASKIKARNTDPIQAFIDEVTDRDTKQKLIKRYTGRKDKKLTTSEKMLKAYYDELVLPVSTQ